jgi:hypothetical protein
MKQYEWNRREEGDDACDCSTDRTEVAMTVIVRHGLIYVMLMFYLSELRQFVQYYHSFVPSYK